jgi:hypothetical protein
MITIILIALTWYLTKLFYTGDPIIHLPELEDNGLLTAKCNKCSQFIVTTQDNMRSPFYCMVCR